MDKPMSDYHFIFMSFGYKFRDGFLPRRNILDEVGIKEGFHILDYGCGPGGYVAAASKIGGQIRQSLRIGHTYPRDSEG